MSLPFKRHPPYIITNDQGIKLYNCNICGYLELEYFYQTNIKRKTRCCIKCHGLVIKKSKAKLKSVPTIMLNRIRQHFRTNQQLLKESVQPSTLCLGLNGVNTILNFWNNTSALSGKVISNVTTLSEETPMLVVLKTPYPKYLCEEHLILVTYSEGKLWNKLNDNEKRQDIFGINVIHQIEIKLKQLSETLRLNAFRQNSDPITSTIIDQPKQE